MRKVMQLRETFRPYINAELNETARTGLPFNRPLWYDYPADAGTWAVTDQFMFGAKYLVAPVTARGATARPVVFPKGARWRPVGGGAPVSGGQTLKVAAHLSTRSSRAGLPSVVLIHYYPFWWRRRSTRSPSTCATCSSD